MLLIFVTHLVMCSIGTAECVYMAVTLVDVVAGYTEDHHWHVRLLLLHASPLLRKIHQQMEPGRRQQSTWHIRSTW